MTDGVIKGTGNSRYLKTVSTAPTTYPTYESFIQALAAGTLPIDLNGINSTGWTTQGTKLNKANLLTDATAALAGLTSSATPNTMFAKLANSIKSIDTSVGTKIGFISGSYIGNSAESRTINFGKEVSFIFVFGDHDQNQYAYPTNLNTNFAFLPAKNSEYASSLHDAAVVHNGSSFTILNTVYFNYSARVYYYVAFVPVMFS